MPKEPAAAGTTNARASQDGRISSDLRNEQFQLYFDAFPGQHLLMASGPIVYQCNSEGIQELCRQIADGLQAAGNCPCCSSSLQVTISRQGVEVSCPSGCFHFDCRRDPHTGKFLTGSLDFPDPKCAVPAAQAGPSGTEATRPAG